MNEAQVEAPAPNKLCIIAGSGDAPRALIEACHKLGRPFFVVCLEGQASNGLADGFAHEWLGLGAWSRLKQIAQQFKLTEAVMIGGVRRPSVSEIKPDLLALKVLTKIGLSLLGDDALLQTVGKAVEEETGMKVIAVQDVFTDLLTPEGQLGSIKLNKQAEHDVMRGAEIALTMGRLDVGQAVVVQQGLVLGVEAIEGTDALLNRCASLRRQGAGPVLVKIAKPQQDNRFDLPTIGPETIEQLRYAGMRGVAIQARRSILIERAKTIAAADAAGIFIVGIDL